MALTICSWISCNCFQLLRDKKLENLANGNEMFDFPEEISKQMFWKSTAPFDFRPRFPDFIY